MTDDEYRGQLKAVLLSYEVRLLEGHFLRKRGAVSRVECALVLKENALDLIKSAEILESKIEVNYVKAIYRRLVDWLQK